MTGMSYEAFGRAYQRILFDEWRGLMLAGYLTEAGLLAVRARLLHGHEFEPGADRDSLVWQLSDALAAMRGSEPGAIPSALGLTAPDDASALDG